MNIEYIVLLLSPATPLLNSLLSERPHFTEIQGWQLKTGFTVLKTDFSAITSVIFEITIREGGGAICNAVSYTHLDVYKRQTTHSVIITAVCV